jgi:hypothetical protein
VKIFFMLCIYLVGIFLYRVLIPGGEYDSRIVVYLTIGLDLICLAVLIPSKKAAEREVVTRQQEVLITTVFVIALIAGLGSLAIRLNGNASFWTGHFRHEFSALP